jgi:hypothetical protein
VAHPKVVARLVRCPPLAACPHDAVIGTPWPMPLGSAMLRRVEKNPSNEHHLYMVLFITNGGGI